MKEFLAYSITSNQCFEDLLAKLLFLQFVNLYYLKLVNCKHWPVIRELMLSSVIVQGLSRLTIIQPIDVVQQLVLELRVTIKQNAVAPSWNSLLLGSIVNFAVLVIPVSWVEIKRCFFKLI